MVDFEYIFEVARRRSRGEITDPQAVAEVAGTYDDGDNQARFRTLLLGERASRLLLAAGVPYNARYHRTTFEKKGIFRPRNVKKQRLEAEGWEVVRYVEEYPGTGDVVIDNQVALLDSGSLLRAEHPEAETPFLALVTQEWPGGWQTGGLPYPFTDASVQLGLGELLVRHDLV